MSGTTRPARQLEQARTVAPVRAGPGDRAGGAGLRPGGADRRWASTRARSCRRWPPRRAPGSSPRSARSTCRGRPSGPARSPAGDTPYYYPGGRFQGRPVPAGWYSTPWWKTALGAGAGVLGGMLIVDALFSPAFADPGYGYDAGYQEGFGDGDRRRRRRRRRPGRGGDFGGGDSAAATTAAATSAAATSAAATSAVATSAAATSVAATSAAATSCSGAPCDGNGPRSAATGARFAYLSISRCCACRRRCR